MTTTSGCNGDVPRELDRFVYRETSRHGKPTYYFRRGKGKRIRLPDPFADKAAYDLAYIAARDAGQAPAKIRGGHGTLEWLIQQYRTNIAYTGRYSTATRRQRDNIFEGVVDRSGHVEIRKVTRAKIMLGVQDRKETPAQARNFLDAMRGLFRWAVANEHVKADPTEGVTNPKREDGDGFPAWTDDDVEAYEKKWPIGTKERVWLAVLLYTGLRRGDAVVLGRQHLKDGIYTLTTEKTGTPVFIPVFDDEFPAILEAGPTADLAYICGDNGKPLTKESFGNYFRRACGDAKVSKSAHGLRKLSATRAAETGLSVATLEAMFGWKGGTMASFYTESADRKRLAKVAGEWMRNAKAPHLETKNPAPKKSTN